MNGRGAKRASISSTTLLREAQHAGRHAVADLGILHGALHHQCQAAARHRGRAAERARRATRRPAAGPDIDGPETQSRRDHSARHAPSRAPARCGADGSSSRSGRSRCRARGCRSTTCIGRPAVVLEQRRQGAASSVGLTDGRIVPLAVPEHVDRRRVSTSMTSSTSTSSRAKIETTPRPSCASRPKVQGAAVVLENKTGRILAMAGGFSYPLSQLNRTSQALRQPGSSIKPLTYLAALHRGLQPNTLVLDRRSPCRRSPASATHYWTPKNYDGSSRGLDDAAARAGEFEEPRHRAPARRRHRQEPDQEPGADLRSGGGSANLSGMHEELSVRARRPGAADDRSRRLLRRDRQ